MFTDIIEALKEAMGSPGDIDTGDLGTPVKPASGPPPIPLKGIRGYQPPAKLAPLRGLPPRKPRPPAYLSHLAAFKPKRESYDIRNKIISNLTHMDKKNKETVASIKDKANDIRNRIKPKAEMSSIFSKLINEMRDLTELMAKSGLPKKMRQDIMTRSIMAGRGRDPVTTKVSSGERRIARSMARGLQNSDPLKHKADRSNAYNARIKHDNPQSVKQPQVGGKYLPNKPVGALQEPGNRRKLQKRFG